MGRVELYQILVALMNIGDMSGLRKLVASLQVFSNGPRPGSI